MLLLEGSNTIDRGVRSLPLTLPSFTHDVFSAVHPLTAAPPFFRQLDIAAYCLQWAH